MFIHCKVRGNPNAIPPIPDEEIYLGVANIQRADPEQDTQGGFIRIVPSDSERVTFAIIPLNGPTDPFSVILWWLAVMAQVGVADGQIYT